MVYEVVSNERKQPTKAVTLTYIDVSDVSHTGYCPFLSPASLSVITGGGEGVTRTRPVASEF